MSNKGTTKIKAISRRALEIREKAGFTTETIVKKRYRMVYVPDAIKQAAKELKKETRTVKTKQLSRRAGQSTKAGVKVVKAGVSEKVTSAVRVVLKLKKFSDINFPSGKLLYSIKKVAGRFTIPEKDIDNPTIKMLLDGYYIETLGFSGKYKVTKSGAEFIKLVDQHIKNAKTDKFNPRLFK